MYPTLPSVAAGNLAGLAHTGAPVAVLLLLGTLLLLLGLFAVRAGRISTSG